jgi:hypothetical protein
MKSFKSIRTALILLLALVFVIWLDLWKNYSTEAESFFKSVIAPIFDKTKIPLVYYLLASAFLVVFHRDRVKSLQEEATNELELQIKANRQLSEYRRRDVLYTFLKRFVSAQPAVHAVQMYQYTVKKQQDVVIFRVKHINGFVDEGIQLNALEQIYYRVDRQMYRDFISAKAMWDKADNPKKLIDFVKQYGKLLEPLTPDRVLEDDAIIFAMVQLAVDLIEPYMEVDLEISISEDLFNALNVRKRTGILRAILLEDDFYRFSYIGGGEKKGRMYLCQSMMLWGVNHACLITLDSETLYDENTIDQLDEIESDFIEGIYKEFNLVYNGEHQRNEGDNE